MAPAPIESALLAHPDIDQALVSGANQPQPFALLVLSPEQRARPLGSRGEMAVALELQSWFARPGRVVWG